MSRRLRCRLLGHSWRASVTAGGRAVLVSCNWGCSIGPDLVPITKAQHASLLHMDHQISSQITQAIKLKAAKVATIPR